MNKSLSLLGGIAAPVLLLVAGVAIYVWATIPPEPDPDAREDYRLVKLWTSNLADALYIEPIAALGLDADGALRLMTQDGLEHRIAAGDVFFLSR